MQDQSDSLVTAGRQALQVQQAALDLWDQWARLGLAAQTAWLDLWARPVLQASADLKAQQEQQARVDRLGRRGTPEQRDQSARQALKEIAVFRARMALQERLAPPGLLDQLVLKVCRAFLDRWERQERRALLDPLVPQVP